LKPSFIVHGGAGNIPDESLPAVRSGIRRALEAGWNILTKSGAAIDAVTAAIVILEDDPAFDAGVGSHLNRDGRVQLDAIVMDGASLKAGAVAAVERVRNPILLARLVQERSEHMMLVGAGAEQFAQENGISLCANEDLVTERARAAWHEWVRQGNAGSPNPAKPAKKTDGVDTGGGTVGAVAFDSQGRLVAGTSTGGTRFKYPGRVGDSPLIGCGCYADVEAGGVSCTGHGEGIMKIVMAKLAVDHLRGPRIPDAPGDTTNAAQARPVATPSLAQSVADSAVRTLAERTGSTGGLILLDSAGNPAAAFNTARMAYGFLESDGSLRIIL
jgi:beta-aspartyl-peptidase (threonine type)